MGKNGLKNFFRPPFFYMPVFNVLTVDVVRCQGERPTVKGEQNTSASIFLLDSAGGHGNHRESQC